MLRVRRGKACGSAPHSMARTAAAADRANRRAPGCRRAGCRHIGVRRRERLVDFGHQAAARSWAVHREGFDVGRGGIDRLEAQCRHLLAQIVALPAVHVELLEGLLPASTAHLPSSTPAGPYRRMFPGDRCLQRLGDDGIGIGGGHQPASPAFRSSSACACWASLAAIRHRSRASAGPWAESQADVRSVRARDSASASPVSVFRRDLLGAAAVEVSVGAPVVEPEALGSAATEAEAFGVAALGSAAPEPDELDADAPGFRRGAGPWRHPLQMRERGRP